MSYATGTFQFLTTDSIGTTKTVTPGFTAKLVRCTWSGRGDTADAIGRATKRRGRGFGTSSLNRLCVGNINVDAAASATAGSVKRVDAIVATVSSGNIVDGLGDISSITSTTVVFIVDDVFPVNLTVTWEAWGGDSITNVFIGEFQLSATTGAQSQTFTGVGFQGDMLMVAATGFVATGNASNSTDCILSYGACTGAGDEHVVMGAADDGSTTTDCGGNSRAGEILTECGVNVGAPSATGQTTRCEFTSWNSDGFVWQLLEHATASRTFIAAVIKGGSWTVGDFVTRTTTGTITLAALSYTPVGISVYSAGRAASAADDLSNHDRFSVGSWDGANHACQADLDEGGGIADMEVTTAIDFNALYVNIDTASAVEGEIAGQTLADPIVLNQNNADAAAYFAWFESFGAVEAAVASHFLFKPRIRQAVPVPIIMGGRR